jgi:hypothetical protein
VHGQRLIAAIAGAAVVIAGAACMPRMTAPASALTDALGIRRGLPVDRRFCGEVVRSTPLGELPTGDAVCAWYRPESPTRRADLRELKFHLISRRVAHAQRSWETLDTASWRHELDSVRTALRGSGGTLEACRSWSANGADEVREQWRFPAFQVLLFSGRRTAPDSSPGQPGRAYTLLIASRAHEHWC